MKRFLLTLCASAALAAAAAVAADKPVVYNSIHGEATEIDRQATAALAPQYTIVALQDAPDYVEPKPTAGQVPRLARAPAGGYLEGYVLIAYVVTAEGGVAAPTVLKTTDERLNATALQAMKEWRYTPATLKGAAIASLSAQEFYFEATPTEFVPQVLEPLGGKISRPKDWHYSEAHDSRKYDWSITREDTAGGKGYTTGVRILTFAKISETTSKTAREFIAEFVKEKKKEAGVKVLKNCGEDDQGLFTRTCLETEEGPFHVLYSLFWGSKNLDLAVIMFAGTRKELWEVYQPAFQKMRAMELIDMKRFDK